jgi:hypothetical protein
MGRYVSRRIGRLAEIKYGLLLLITPRTTSIATAPMSLLTVLLPALERHFFEIDVDG